MSAKKIILPALLLLLSMVALAGCDYRLTKDDEKPASPTEPTAIITALAGTCRTAASGGQVVCEDRSTSEPSGRIRSITFNLQDRNGLLVESRTASPTSEAPRQVLFLGLPPGQYQVEHVVVDTNGHATSRTYRDLQVF